MEQPKLLKGFRDFLPSYEKNRVNLIQEFSKVCELYNFAKIDTPILEYKNILLANAGGETEKQIYSFVDNGSRDVAMRFDLTIPFARFYALNKEKLEFPFKRFQIGKVFRGENTQRGRYREFMQFDFDIVGSNSPLCVKELFLFINDCFLRINQNITIHFFSRKIFNDLISYFNIKNSVQILRVVDKIKKVGLEKTKQELLELSDEKTVDAILEFVTKKDCKDIISYLKKKNIDTNEMEDLISFSIKHKINLYLDPSITRGLDYYTGVVFETFLDSDISIGSVCSGGRYENLISHYSKEETTGIGGSFGVDRILASLEEKPVEYFLGIINLDSEIEDYYLNLLHQLRVNLIPVELYFDNKKIKNQFNYFEKKNVRYVLILGNDEIENNSIKIKDIKFKREFIIKEDELIRYIKDLYKVFIKDSN